MSPVREAFDKADALIEKVLAMHPITCRKGCSYCCYIPNMITVTEAEYLIDNEKTPSIKRIKKRLIPENALILNGRSDTYCDIVPLEIRKCVYLKSDECSVYESRPLSCRGNLVVTDPKLCDTGWPYKIESVGYVNHMPFTMLALGLSMDLGTLPEQLFKVLKRRGEYGT